MAELKSLIVNGSTRLNGDTFVGTITADTFKKNGGTSSQFLKADGSVEVLTAGTGIGLTRASGSATISVAGVPREVLTTSHYDLVLLRDRRRLSPGQWYRITDYNPTFDTTGSNGDYSAGELQSGHHPFDILIMATSYNSFAPDAYACLHSGDTYFSNAKCDLSKWKLKYALTDPYEDEGLSIRKYSWCVANRDGGIIYEMIDECGNECPYDFKNLMFRFGFQYSAGYHSSSIPDTSTHPTINNQRYFYTFSYSNYASYISNSNNTSHPTLDFSVHAHTYTGSDTICREIYNNTIKPHLLIKETSDERDQSYPIQMINYIVLAVGTSDDYQNISCYNNHFGYDTSKVFFAFNVNDYYSDYETHISNNKVGDGCKSIFLQGPQIVYFNIEDTCSDIISRAGEDMFITNIKIEQGCNKIKFDASDMDILSTSIGRNSNNISIYSSRYTTIGRGCVNLNIEYNCAYNDIGASCNEIILSGNCDNNIFGGSCASISLGNNCSRNVFEKLCVLIALFDISDNNKFEVGCSNICFRTSSSSTWNSSDVLSNSNARAYGNTFKPGCNWINLYNADGNVRRMHVFSSASSFSAGSLQQISVTTKTDSSTSKAIDECVARTTSTGAPVIKSPCY